MWGQLYSGFRRGMPIAAIPVRWFVTVTAWLNGMTIEGGHIERTPDGIRIYPGTYNRTAELIGVPAFRVTKTGNLSAEIAPGEVELGPATRLTWDGKRIINGTVNAASGCLTNHLTDQTTITVPSGNTVWYVWANVNIVEGAETWEIFEGEAVTALVESEDPSAEIKVIRQKIIAVLTIADDVITGVENKTCGNIDIPRL